MNGSHIENRTLGELAAMRDTLQVARKDMDSDRTVLAVGLMLDVLESIVDGTPFFHSPRVRAAVEYKPPAATKPRRRDA